MAESKDMSVNSAPTGRAWLKWLLGLLIGGAAAFYIVQQLPGQGYPTDLSRVGAGTPTLVLARDGGFIGGAEVMELMNDMRADYTSRMDFLVTNLKLQEGANFAAQHGARDGSVMFFDSEGRRRGVMHMPPNAATLRAAIDKVLAAEGRATEP